MHEQWDRLRRIISNTIAGGTQAGEFAAIDSAVATAVALGITRAIVNHLGGKQPPAEIAATASQLFLDGLCV
ncbi:MAG TPA: hypothetical protein ENN09_02580 [Planctomycetes bacterium]|nr:hypothetical protein [Planctomycetota bacterium]